MIVAGGRGDRQRLEDRRDPVLLPLVVDEIAPARRSAVELRHRKTSRRLRRISQAWRNSRVSRSSAFIFPGLSAGMPARRRLSASAFLTRSFGVWAVQPIFAAIDIKACQRDAC